MYQTSRPLSLSSFPPTKCGLFSCLCVAQVFLESLSLPPKTLSCHSVMSFSSIVAHVILYGPPLSLSCFTATLCFSRWLSSSDGFLCIIFVFKQAMVYTSVEDLYRRYLSAFIWLFWTETDLHQFWPFLSLYSQIIKSTQECSLRHSNHPSLEHLVHAWPLTFVHSH
jgi:hypothetical protein